MTEKTAKMRIGVLASHPIQYQAPLFRELAREVDLTVYFAHRQTAEGQARAGYGVAFDWDVDLLSGYASEFLQNQAKNPNVFNYGGCDTPEIATIIQKGDFDAFIVTGWYLKSYWQAIRACRRHGVPVLVRGDSQLHTPRSWLKRMAKKVVYRWIMRQFDGYLYVGKRNLEYLLYYGATRERCFFSPHFIDVDWFRTKSHQTDEERRALRLSLGVQEDEKLLLFVGRLVEMKCPSDLLKAAALLKAQGVAVRPVYVGSGRLEADLVKQAQRLGIKASFAGFKNQSELPVIYAAADLFILPSESETWGLTVNEAQACGTLAVISTAVGCMPDLIADGMTGKSYVSGDLRALADAVMTMLPRVQTEACLKALQDKSAEYSVSNAVAGIITAISSVAQGKVKLHG